MSIHVTTIKMYVFISFFFFFNDTATTEIYTLSLHDALPISERAGVPRRRDSAVHQLHGLRSGIPDRKSTRLNSSHVRISYAVFCLKKKKKKDRNDSFQHDYTPTQHSYRV